jgi:ribonuclease HII
MPDLLHEKQFKGPVIGIDEAGRGPWAGPLTVSAIWLATSDAAGLPDGIDDSKKLNPERRAQLAELLCKQPFFHHTVSIDVSTIDQIGILQATFRGMKQAAAGLMKTLVRVGLPTPVHALIDGNLLPPEMPLPATALVKGDNRSLSIAAASILAKVSRDNVMVELHKVYPHYSWDRNMGYGTKAHVAGLEKHGVSPYHRHSFKPIRRYLDVAAS